MRSITAILLVAFCFNAAGCARNTGEPAHKSNTLRYFDLINVDVRNVPLLMALDELQTQGYIIEKTHLASGVLIADALARGDADIGMLNNQTMWIAIAKGAPVRTIAQYTSSTLVIAAKQNIASCRELNSRRLAMPATRGLSPMLFDWYLKQNCPGVAPEIVVIPESAGRAAALLSGEIDASAMPGEELLKVQRKAPGQFHEILSYAHAFPDIQIDGLHVRRQWAEQNPELVKDFLRALLSAHRRVGEHPQLLFDESVKRLALDPETAKTVGEAHLRMRIWDANGGMTSENLQHTLDFLINMAALAPGAQVKEFADLSYLNAVLEEIRRR